MNTDICVIANRKNSKVGVPAKPGRSMSIMSSFLIDQEGRIRYAAYDSRQRLEIKLANFQTCYNHNRAHSSLWRQHPAEFARGIQIANHVE